MRVRVRVRVGFRVPRQVAHLRCGARPRSAVVHAHVGAVRRRRLAADLALPLAQQAERADDQRAERRPAAAASAGERASDGRGVQRRRVGEAERESLHRLAHALLVRQQAAQHTLLRGLRGLRAHALSLQHPREPGRLVRVERGHTQAGWRRSEPARDVVVARLSFKCRLRDGRVLAALSALLWHGLPWARINGRDGRERRACNL